MEWVQFSSFQSFSHVWFFVNPCIAARQASLSIINSWSLLKLMSMRQRCHPTISCSVVPFSSCLPASGSFTMRQFFTSGSQNIGVSLWFSSVQSLSRVWLFVIPRTAAHQASLSIINSWSLLKLMSIELMMPSNHLILCHPLLLPSIFPSLKVFSSESALHIRWPKYWSFSFSISSSSEYSGLISFRMDWFDLLPVQGTLKSILQHYS